MSLQTLKSTLITLLLYLQSCLVLLGAAIFIGWMHLPLSAPFVGGLVLSLMTLPTVIITTRASLKAVPPSIRQTALGLGASKVQTVFHHVLPLALPGIMTGAIVCYTHSVKRHLYF